MRRNSTLRVSHEIVEHASMAVLEKGAKERGGELSSGISPGAAAYHHYVYAAHLLTSVLR
ncbi:hypothetical protein T05_6461 [Trichinella murrelli]|uniref:Uncharacterized protein n=1 Tax=Trichinella murrelli TaxID=144512 RepID=A0A0V0UED2_9BILA|nr:hypothetical protein T05_6461 [Trichinella murrelli]